jgi:hypothetical protein
MGLVSVDGLLDLLHDVVNLGHASGVDSPALLLACLAADVGGNVVKDGGLGDVDHVNLAEGGGNGELILLKYEDSFYTELPFSFSFSTYIELVQWLGVEVADKKLGAVVDVSLVLLGEDGVEVRCLTAKTVVATEWSESESPSVGNVPGDGTLGGTIDESLADEDLGTNDDGCGGEQLGVCHGHGADEGKNNDEGLHFL